MYNNYDGSFSYRHELIRKAIHFCSLSIPIAYYYLPNKPALAVLSALTFLSVAVDIARYHIPFVAGIFYNWFGVLLRKHEKESLNSLSGASFVFISALLNFSLFPELIAVVSFSIFILGDLSAALVGSALGKTKFLNKSLEGSAAFFLVGLTVIFLTPKYLGTPNEYLIWTAGLSVGVIAENISGGYFDDNLIVPFLLSLCIWILYFIFLPQF